jgi:4-oxalocrotonate tautomerase
MPMIQVQMFEGRTAEQKAALAQALTEATVRALGVPPDSVDVVLTEVSKAHWSTGGVLWSERKPST